jgi:cobalt-zinc-cadmium efflux system outer membrane protein
MGTDVRAEHPAATGKPSQPGTRSRENARCRPRRARKPPPTSCSPICRKTSPASTLRAAWNTLAQTSLLPQAELTFKAALAGYETGKVDFATLLDAQRQIRKAKQDVIKAQAEQQGRLADIERLIGEDL